MSQITENSIVTFGTASVRLKYVGYFTIKGAEERDYELGLGEAKAAVCLYFAERLPTDHSECCLCETIEEAMIKKEEYVKLFNDMYAKIRAEKVQ